MLKFEFGIFEQSLFRFNLQILSSRESSYTSCKFNRADCSTIQESSGSDNSSTFGKPLILKFLNVRFDFSMNEAYSDELPLPSSIVLFEGDTKLLEDQEEIPLTKLLHISFLFSLGRVLRAYEDSKQSISSSQLIGSLKFRFQTQSLKS